MTVCTVLLFDSYCALFKLTLSLQTLPTKNHVQNVSISYSISKSASRYQTVILSDSQFVYPEHETTRYHIRAVIIHHSYTL